MAVTTPGKLMIDEALPEDMRGKTRELHASGIRELAQELATKHPDKYRDVIHKLMQVSSDAMYSSGGYSFGLRHMLPSKAFSEFRQRMEQQIQTIASDPSLSEEEKSKKFVELAEKEQGPITKKVFEESLAGKNPLALQIHSGTKGKPFNLMSLVGGDLLYEDQHNRKIPIPVLRSYSEGLRPGEYWAGTYGARKGVVDLKMATQDAGYFSKQLVQAAHRLVVTAHDDETAHDGNSPRGYPTNVDDLDNEGALLANDVGPYTRNTILTPKILSHLKQLGHQHFLVRSPTVGGPADGGVYARDVGVRERGTISPIGDFVGIGAAQSACLSASTQVRMADGSCKAIRDIQPGDVVIGVSPEGVHRPATVLNKFDNGFKSCYEFTFKRNNRFKTHRLHCTLEHKVLLHTDNKDANPEIVQIGSFVGKTVVAAKTRVKRFDESYLSKEGTNESQSQLGLRLRQRVDVRSRLRRCPLVSMTPIGWRRTYDIYIDHPNHLFVLKNGLVVSNSEPISQAQIGCLAKGTLVRMASLEVKRIENIKVGDFVLGADMQGRPSPTRVSHHFDKGTQSCVEVSFGPKKTICATTDHKILCKGEADAFVQVPLGKVETIVRLDDIDFETTSTFTKESVKELGELQTYDIEVEHPSSLFVLANGLIVSNSKHTGGVAGAGAGVSGFKAINQLVQVPKVFPGGATHSQVDGRVQKIDQAPGGGFRIFIGDKAHYVPVGLDIKAKPGDVVEAGDMLTNGLPNPSEIVRHKGLGEGRKAFVDAFMQTARDANFKLHRRNVELVARGLLNHVVLKDSMGSYLPDDVAPYNSIEKEYQPRPGHRTSAPGDSVGYYLERPVLHHTIGTKIKPSHVEEFKKYGVKQLLVHHEPPPFEPEMIRGMANLSHDQDWMTRMLGSNLEKGLLQATHRGSTSDELGTSYVPSLARGVDFGKSLPIKGYDVKAIKPSPSSLVEGWK